MEGLKEGGRVKIRGVCRGREVIEMEERKRYEVMRGEGRMKCVMGDEGNMMRG